MEKAPTDEESYGTFPKKTSLTELFIKAIEMKSPAIAKKGADISVANGIVDVVVTNPVLTYAN